jgi:uncharacterized protein YbbC (DUF1343 family)/CubicO group peptidase (beta-lactamase class C family)
VWLLGALIAVCLAPDALAAGFPDFTAVDEAARDAMASGEIAGAVIRVGQGDVTLLSRGYGARALLPGAPRMTVDTIFDIASLTKPLGTTLAVMALVERGAVALDASLGRYLVEFQQPTYTGVTIRRLLAHTAGLAPAPPVNSVTAGFPAAAAAMATLKLQSTPGAAFRYSDTGFILLGEVVRRVSGQPLDRFLGQTFFEPLRLTDTTFHPARASVLRIAPTEFHNGRLLQGQVHDPRARALGGVAGHAGLFSTAEDLARICRMLLGGGILDGRQVLRPETVKRLWEPVAEAGGVRTLGWDRSSAYARSMAPFFPPGSVGHTGFTGTAVWLHPRSQTYLILLTNRVHPNGGGAARILELRTRVAAAVGAALFRSPRPPEPSTSGAALQAPAPTVAAALDLPVRTGLDLLAGQGFAALRGQAVGLITNQTGVDAHGRRAIDLLARAPGVRLAAIFSPEHGIAGTANAEVPDGRDPATGRPIWSLYGETRRPTPAMLRGVTALVFDVQDVGVRYYTYLTTLLYAMEEAARHDLPLFVLDRPNPITGRAVEGPLLDEDLESFTGPHALPVRTGLTIGEYARMVAAERGIPVALTVVPLEGWSRSRWYDQTGLPWINPSPNIRSVTQALLYAGIGLLEGTNLSVGRGTETPFEVVGAPWIDADTLAAALNREGLAGVRFEPAAFTPTEDRFARLPCAGVRLVVTDRERLRPVEMGLALARALRAAHPDVFRPEAIQNLLVNRATMWAFLRGAPLDRLVAWSRMDRQAYLARRAAYLLYP